MFKTSVYPIIRGKQGDGEGEVGVEWPNQHNRDANLVDFKVTLQCF